MPQEHRLSGLRACSCSQNKQPATDWNPNTHYYSSTPEDTNGLFFSESLGVLELGMEHNTQFVRALSKERNYWRALERVKNQGYDNGHVRVSASFLTTKSGDILSGLATKLVGGSKRVYPMGPDSLEPKNSNYKRMVETFNPETIQQKGAKIFHLSLVTGYENESQRKAFTNDANQLAENVKNLYGANIVTAEIYDPATKKDKSLVGFAKYLYQQTDNLPKGSIVIVEVFTHGDKSPFMHRETPESKLRVERVGTLSWGSENGLSDEVNEWEFRQVINSLGQHLTVIVKGNQCMGGQFCKGEELILPKFLAPANKKK